MGDNLIQLFKKHLYDVEEKGKNLANCLQRNVASLANL